MEKCYVAGASGLIGNELIQALFLDPQVKRIFALGRRSLKLQNHKLIEKITNFKDLESFPLNSELISHAFCCLGTTIKKAGSRDAFWEIDHDTVIHFAHFCKNQGVKHFIIVSSAGANPKSTILYSRVKGLIERDLEAIGFERLTILRPSILLGERKEGRPLEKVGQYLGKILAPFFVGPLLDFCPIEAKVVARKMKELSFSHLNKEKNQDKYFIEIISNKDIF